MDLWKKWYQTTKSSICQNQKLNHDDQTHELSSLSKKTPKKKTQAQKCNICHIVHLVSTNKLGTNYSFNTKLGTNLRSTTRLMVIGQFWRWLNTLLGIMFTFITSSDCYPPKIDYSCCWCPFLASKCSFKTSSSKKLSLLGYWSTWTTLLSWKTWSWPTSLPREGTTP